jgi:predicted HD phosphohydrolase
VVGMTTLSVDELMELLTTGVGRPLAPQSRVSQLDHALQTAQSLQRRHPDDPELAVAGLVHDVGHLLPGGRDETHAEDAAAAVRETLGPRVAGMVGLHVEAKRYLVAVETGYGGALAADSMSSLAHQGGAMGSDETAAFLALPWAGDAVILRRADDRGKDEGDTAGSGSGVGSGPAPRALRRWVEVMRRCEREHGHR